MPWEIPTMASSKPIFEEEAGSTINAYGRSKFMIERILSDYRSLRYFNACGADASGSIGELQNSETHLIQRALMALQGHVSDFAIYGTDYVRHCDSRLHTR